MDQNEGGSALGSSRVFHTGSQERTYEVFHAGSQEHTYEDTPRSDAAICSAYMQAYSCQLQLKSQAL